jgi:hypothetical protein
MKAPDGRHRDKTGQIEKKHGNTLIKNLAPDYPALKTFVRNGRLSKLEEKFKVDSLDGVLKAIKKTSRPGGK